MWSEELGPGLRSGYGSPLGVLLGVLLTAGSAAGQSATIQAAPPLPSVTLTVDVDVVGLGLTYAWQVAADRHVGLDAGLGGGWVNVMLFSGAHFSESGGPSYGGHDGADNKDLLEVAHAQVFHRWTGLGAWSIEAGARGAVFLHSDSSDDDPGGGWFLGLASGTFVGSERFRVGFRMTAGIFAESNAREFGLLLVPLTGRVAFGW